MFTISRWEENPHFCEKYIFIYEFDLKFSSERIRRWVKVYICHLIILLCKLYYLKESWKSSLMRSRCYLIPKHKYIWFYWHPNRNDTDNLILWKQVANFLSFLSYIYIYLISWPGWYSLVDVAHRFLLELIFVIFHFVQWSCSLGGTIPWGDWSVFSWTMLHRVPRAPYFTSTQLPVILNELKPRSCNDAALLDSPVCRGIEF